MAAVRKVLTHAGVDTSCYFCHSLRVGAAMTPASIGLSDKKLG